MVTIKFWLMPNAGFESKQVIDKEIEIFQELHPRIDVSYEIFSWSRAWFKLMEAIKEKSGPDIIQIGTTWIGTLSYLGAIQKLDNKHIDHREFSSFSFNLCRRFEHLWAIPWFCEGRALFYRKDYLEKAGLDILALDTWDSFQATCTKIGKLHTHAHQIVPLGFSSHKEQGMIQDIASWVWSHGGSFLSYDGKYSSVNQSPARQGIRYFLDLISSNHISKQSLMQSAGEIAENFFFRDEYAFLLASSWPLQVYFNPSFKSFIGRNRARNFGVVQLPSGPAGRFNFAGGSALSITSFTRHPEEAWTFLKFLTGKDALSRYCQNINMIPSRKDVPVVLDQMPEAQLVFPQAINKYGRSFPEHPLWGSIEQIIVNGFAQSLRDYHQGDFKQDIFLQNLFEISQEIDLILSVFGE